MRMIGGMKAYTFEELLDKFYGPIGTPERDAFEAMVEAGLEEERRKLEAKQQQACKADETVRDAPRTQHRSRKQPALASVPAELQLS